MNSITFTCEVVTPMFLAGADGEKPELRPPSIKGAMRFWWRAMNGNMDVKTLREKECEIFGGGGEDAKRSRVIIRTKEQKWNIEGKTLWEDIQYKPVNKKHGSGTYNKPINGSIGVHYLLYSVFMNERGYIKPGSTFEVSFHSNDLSSLRETLKAFAFLVFFGGLGSRTRRGAGVIAVIDIAGNAKSPLSEPLKVFDTRGVLDTNGLKAHIEGKLGSFIGKSVPNGKYSAINGSSVYLLGPKDNWQKALDVIGLPYKTERNRLKSQVEKTPNFGFPIQHKETKYKRKLTMGGGIPYKKDGEWKVKDFSERRSSPLIVSLIKAQNDKFFPIALNLTGELLPSGKKIVDKYANELTDAGSELKNRGVDPDGLFIMKAFLEKLKKNPDLTL